MPDQLTSDTARQLTDRIRGGVADVLDLIAEAFDGRADTALGYASWDRYCHAEFPAVRWGDNRQRGAAVVQLRERRMSNRAIGHALGMDESTVRNDLRRTGSTAGNPAVAQTVVSLDNRERPAGRCAPVQVHARITTSPYHYARQADAIVTDIDRQDYQPGDLTTPQLGAVKMLRDTLAEFAAVMHDEEAAQDLERAQ